MYSVGQLRLKKPILELRQGCTCSISFSLVVASETSCSKHPLFFGRLWFPDTVTVERV